MIAGDGDAVGGDTIEEPASRRLGAFGIGVEGDVPAGIGDEQSGRDRDVAGHDQLRTARADVIGGVAGRMARRSQASNARQDLDVVPHPRDVRPDRQRRLDAPRQSVPAVRQHREDLRVGPEVVLRRRHDDLAFGKHLGVGVRLHQAEDVIGMEMRNQDRVDVVGTKACRRHVIEHRARGRHPLAPGAGIDQDGSAARLEQGLREFDGDVTGRKPAFDERVPCVIDGGVQNEVVGVILSPDAVIERRASDIADLVSKEPRLPEDAGERRSSGASRCRRGRGRQHRLRI